MITLQPQKMACSTFGTKEKLLGDVSIHKSANFFVLEAKIDKKGAFAQL